MSAPQKTTVGRDKNLLPLALYSKVSTAATERISDMNAKIQSGRKLRTIIANAKTLHEVLWECWSIITSLISFGFKVALLPILTIIIIADFLIASTIIAVFGMTLAFVMGWIDVNNVLVFVDTHGTVIAAKIGANINQWATAHPNSALSQMLGAGNTTTVMPGPPPAQ